MSPAPESTWRRYGEAGRGQWLLQREKCAAAGREPAREVHIQAIADDVAEGIERAAEIEIGGRRIRARIGGPINGKPYFLPPAGTPIAPARPLVGFGLAPMPSPSNPTISFAPPLRVIVLMVVPELLITPIRVSSEPSKGCPAQGPLEIVAGPLAGRLMTSAQPGVVSCPTSGHTAAAAGVAPTTKAPPASIVPARRYCLKLSSISLSLKSISLLMPRFSEQVSCQATTITGFQ